MLIKRNRRNKHNSWRMTRWLDWLAHFDIAVQHIAGSNLKFTYFLSRNPVEGRYNRKRIRWTIRDNYSQKTSRIEFETRKHLCKRITQQTEQSKNTREQINQSNRKQQSNREKSKREKTKRTSRNQSDKQPAKFQTRAIPNKWITITASLKLKRLKLFPLGPTTEIMGIIRNRRKSPKTLW